MSLVVNKKDKLHVLQSRTDLSFVITWLHYYLLCLLVVLFIYVRVIIPNTIFKDKKKNVEINVSFMVIGYV